MICSEKMGLIERDNNVTLVYIEIDVEYCMQKKVNVEKELMM